MTRGMLHLLIGIGIVIVVVVSAIRKNAERERELQAAGITEDDKSVKMEDVLQSYYQMIGMDGFAISQLAPYGRVMIYGKVFQACCEESVVEKGDSIEVIGVNERTLVVKRLEGYLDEQDEDAPEEDVLEDTQDDTAEEV